MTFEQDINNAVAALRRGGVILYPTDTVWGIGCDATDPTAVRRVFEIKRRADSKALITLVADVADIGRYSAVSPSTVLAIIGRSERPTTVVYPGGCGLAPELLAEDGSVGMRVTGELVSASICRAFGKPLVSTSANISGQPATGIYCEISKEIIDAVDYVVEARRDDCSRSMPSRVIKINADGSVITLRS
ncbi:MAG: threonylcarbamoyl-AMP synthase [Muribaculaceae bacterium]|uniref:L-threonylcarbamoyladenylate synthase n=1 Tax=uncultured Duncaniella sp. TaxID=2768039 RepID=UPI001A2C9484|nr:L-threonylcarbamoyladenylate synthase [uncultured Duncaniella sp.]MBJ2189579.1 threonylcarbamoyl-AMP synthase [Muribaculaceae bacterium]